MRMKLICTVGLPGAGKGIFVKAAEEVGVPIYIMGDIIREKTKEKYGCNDAYYTGLYMKEVREEYGEYIVAKLTLDKIKRERKRASYLLIDGVRNIEEIDYFINRGYKVILIGVLASLYARYERIRRRNRADDIKNLSEFILREDRERKIGLVDVIRRADYYFINEWIEEKEGIRKAMELIKKIMSEEN